LAISQTVNPNSATGLIGSKELAHSSYARTTKNEIYSNETIKTNIAPGTYAAIGFKSRGVNQVIATFKDSNDQTVQSLYLPQNSNYLAGIQNSESLMPVVNPIMPELVVFDTPISSITYEYTWTGWAGRTHGLSTTTGHLNGVLYANGVFVAVGNNTNQFSITTSTDAITWTVRLNTAGTSAFCVAYGKSHNDNRMWVVGGSSGVLWSSTDSITWIQRTPEVASNQINAASFGNGYFVIGGAAGSMATSTDGMSWTSRVSGFGATPINALTYGKGLHVAGGDGGRISTSTDGVTWTTRTSQFGGTDGVRALTFGNGLFLAGGDNGKLSASTDGITWSTRFSNFSTIRALAYGDGLYLMGGDTGTLRVSTDGTNWSFRSAIMESTQIRGITVGEGLGLFTTPTNGTQQTTAPNFMSFPPYNNYPGKMLVAVGGNGTSGSRMATSEAGFEASLSLYKV
jgi:hypothetical protein